MIQFTRVAGIVLIFSSCGGADPPACRGSGEVCAATADCCSSYACLGGRCAAPPPSCRAESGACSSTADCCMGFACASGQCKRPPTCSPSTCPSGCCDAAGACRAGLLSTACGTGGAACATCTSTQRCTSQRCQTVATCKTTGQACTSPAQCCSGLTCRETDGQCGKGSLLDPCDVNAECYSGICVGWCTRGCLNSAGCGASGVCVTNENGADICFPVCPSAGSTYCSKWPGTICRLATDTSGDNWMVCSSP